MRIRPCIDLHAGKVKQIVGSSLRDTPSAGPPLTNYITDRSAADFAARYRQDGLTGGHVIMLGPNNEEQAKAALRAYPGGLQIGGGITPENAGKWLKAGAAKVIVTSYLFVSGELSEERLARMSEAVGPEKLVVDLSCRRVEGEYFVAARRWQEMTMLRLDRETVHGLYRFSREFLVHSVDVEGKRGGIDEPLIRQLGEICPCPVTYAGGISSLLHLHRILQLGNGRVDATVGSALDLFGGSLPYAEVVRFDREMRHG